MVARTLRKLTDASAKAVKTAGRHSDGGGLYLNVSASGSKSWVFMWAKMVTKPNGTIGPKRVEMGLGSYPDVSLAKARTKAAEFRAMIEDGRDPKAERDREVEPTFGECADQFIASAKSQWRNAKHEYQWRQTLGDTYCASLRPKRVSQIGVSDVLAVLSPVWAEKNETASRLRGRIERVLEYAKAKGWRSGENPAAWRGNLRNLLPKRQKLQRGHQPAMPYQQIPKFLMRVRDAEAMAARALEFTILTACRSGEVLGAQWSEFDLSGKVWNIPAERMKAGEPHTVPLSNRAMEIVTALQASKRGDFVFAGEPRPGNKQDAVRGRPLSNMAMIMLLRRMKQDAISVHGFRSAFRDWCGDETSFPREVAEAALAHKVGDSVERAYRRSNALEKRRTLMQAWADFLQPLKGGNVVNLSEVAKRA